MEEMLREESLTVLEPPPDKDFVITPYIEELAEHALSYLKADFPIHFCGPAGTGKSSLAMYVAAKLKRPIVMIHGDSEFGTSDLVGGEYGFHSKKVRDQFIHSVIKTEEERNDLRIREPNRLTASSSSLGSRRMPLQASCRFGVMQSTPR